MSGARRGLALLGLTVAAALWAGAPGAQGPGPERLPTPDPGAESRLRLDQDRYRSRLSPEDRRQVSGSGQACELKALAGPTPEHRRSRTGRSDTPKHLSALAEARSSAVIIGADARGAARPLRCRARNGRHR